jgi:hypothetical protein
MPHSIVDLNLAETHTQNNIVKKVEKFHKKGGASKAMFKSPVSYLLTQGVLFPAPRPLAEEFGK